MAKITTNEMNEITAKVDKALTQFIKNGGYKKVLLQCSNLSNYSFNNQLLIMMQNQNATRVAGFKTWKKQNRYVKAGERAMRILMPLVYKIEDKERDENGNEVLLGYKTIVKGYQCGYVFDISQTDGQEIENMYTMDETQIVENKDKIINSLKNRIGEEGYKVSFVDDLGIGCYGLCNRKTKEIKVLNNLSDVQTISTLAHECGHALAHSKPREDFKGLTFNECKSIKELEAESISCIVDTYLGLDTQKFNFAYITGWTEGDISKFKENLEIITSCARTLIDAIRC